MMNYVRVKYPRTPHLPWSPGFTADDVSLVDCQQFAGHQVVVTEKMDGENTTLYSDYCHARSIDSRHHVSRDWLKTFHGQMKHNIPAGWRICGENLYAKHSIFYASLKSYFYVFSIWNERNECLSWDNTCEWAELLGLVTVPVLYSGSWDEVRIRQMRLDLERQEGYVVRRADAFHYQDFGVNIAKWVRNDHVQSTQHWMKQQVVPNQLSKRMRAGELEHG